MIASLAVDLGPSLDVIDALNKKMCTLNVDCTLVAYLYLQLLICSIYHAIINKVCAVFNIILS